MHTQFGVQDDDAADENGKDRAFVYRVTPWRVIAVDDNGRDGEERKEGSVEVVVGPQAVRDIGDEDERRECEGAADRDGGFTWCV